MTLVPIIYTSLLIFSALFFVVVLISYISYKAKTRGKLPKREADFIKYSPAPVVKPVYVNSNNQVRRHVQAQPVINAAAFPVQKKVYEQNVNSRKNVRIENKESYKREQYQSAQKNDYRNQKSYRTEYIKETKPMKSTRIEIMNETQKFRNTQTAHNAPSSKPSYKNAGLNEMNLLSYYSDSENTELVSLNAAARQAI